MAEEQPELTHREVARKGGYAVLNKYGKEHYTKMVLKRWDNYKKRK